MDMVLCLIIKREDNTEICAICTIFSQSSGLLNMQMLTWNSMLKNAFELCEVLLQRQTFRINPLAVCFLRCIWFFLHWFLVCCQRLKLVLWGVSVWCVGMCDFIILFQLNMKYVAVFHGVLARILPTLPIVIVCFKIRSVTTASQSN